ncbi:MAG: zf-HC2 domain-containing protein [Bacteroidia bacterium]
MDCKETLVHLQDLLDGELDKGLEVRVLEHINNCWHCTEVKQNETKLKELIREKLPYTKATPSSIVNSIKNITSGLD